MAVGGFGYSFGSGSNGSAWGGADDGDDGEAAAKASALSEEGADIDSPAAIHSTAWQLAELRKHYHPTVRDLAAKLAARSLSQTTFCAPRPSAS